MSYILEALKKSEQERQRGKVPDLQTVQEQLYEEPTRRPIWPYLILAALLVNATVLFFWPDSDKKNDNTESKQRISQPQTTSPAKPVTVTSAVESAVRQSAAPRVDQPVIPADPEIKKTPVASVKQPQPSRTKAAAKLPDSSSANQTAEAKIEQTTTPENTTPAGPEITATDQPVNQVIVADQGAPTSALASAAGNPPPQTMDLIETANLPKPEPITLNQPKVTSPHPVKSGVSSDLDWLKESEIARLNKERIFNLQDLPASVRGDLPSFNMSAHFYSKNPAARMISLNGKIIREGQTIEDSLKLDEVTMNGAIFKYKEIRFQVDVF